MCADRARAGDGYHPAMDTATEIPPTDADASTDTSPDTGTGGEPSADQLVEDELLVEEVSIDGMCGVY